MSYEKIIYLGLAMLVVVLIIYVLLPKFKGNTPLIFRAVLFFAAMIFLAYDFYMKGKYLYMIALALGSIAFIAYLRMHKNDPNKKG
ncbi:MAG: hypothetical protein V4658_12420 [Bacteroidota bacterium]